MRKLLAPAILAIVSAAGGATIAAAADPDPVIGTWQLNVDNSTFKPGPVYKSQVRTYSPSRQSIAVVIKTAHADGKETTTHVPYQLDAKHYPVTANRHADSNSV